MSSSPQTLDEILQRITNLPAKQKEAVKLQAKEVNNQYKWIPNPGPQTEAYYSKADVLLYGGEPGGGKDLKLNTPIATVFGWSTMGELTVGDKVFDEHGIPCRVIAKSEVFNRPVYRVTFSDGAQLVAGPGHQWVTGTRAERMRELKCTDEWRAERRSSRPKRGTGKRPDLVLMNMERSTKNSLPTRGVRTTQQIAESLVLPGGRLNHAIDLAGALQLPPSDLLIQPYVLGAWLGDGSSSNGSIAGIDEEIFQQVSNGGYVVTKHANHYSHGVIGLQSHLKQLGVFGNKHIPPCYLRASVDQRLALLQGLMDTDGHCDKRGQCEIQLTRKELIDGVHELLHTLGIKAQMRDGEAKLYGRVTSQKWRLKFQTELPAFRLPRKLIRQKRAGFRGTHAVRYITACDLIEAAPTQCIQVDSPSHCYLAGRAMIPTHNSQLAIGLAFNAHKRSLILRRQYTDLSGLIEDALKINGSRDGFNGSPPPKLKINKTQIINFGACSRLGDEQHFMGRASDLICFDEATQFLYQQVRFLMGWLRHEDPNQRCRVILPTNPPLSAEGLWVISMFAPWLDDRYPYPAKPGELRWVISDEDGNDRWVDGPQAIEISGKMVTPLSRTFIPSSVDDNPFYKAGSYRSKLDAMTEPHRSILLGKFKTAFKDQPNQVIPTAWVKAAQARWTPEPPVGIPMCTMAVDCSGGGEDPMIIAMRHDGWYDHNVRIPGKDIPMDRAGAYSAGQVLSYRRDSALVIVDMGGGYGGPVYEHLMVNQVEARPYKGAEGTTRRSHDGKLRFTNVRSAALWFFREALDPGQPGGSPIALPPNPLLVADLTAPTFEPTPNGIKVESKEAVCDRLGRSTDDGDAVVMAWFEGPKETSHALEWADQKQRLRGQRPTVIMKGRK